MKKMNVLAAFALTAAFAAALFTGCGEKLPAASSLPQESEVSAVSLSETGTLLLRVNPEIAVHYDEKGIVTSVEGVNDDGKALITDDSAYVGKECSEVIRTLVGEINDAGYFVEEADGLGRQITIEIEKGSVLPDSAFLDTIAAEVRSYVGSMALHSPVDLIGETDYGMTDYQDTDYGPDNDGVTDYNDTDYGPDNDGVTDYNDTDYGPDNDGVTNYDDTDYGPNNDGVTDYNDTDYGPDNDGVTDYNDTDYGPDNDGVTNYDDTDYGPDNDGVTNYDDTDYGPNNDGVTDYSSTNYGSTNYDDNGATNYTNYGTTSYGVTIYGDSSYGR